MDIAGSTSTWFDLDELSRSVAFFQAAISGPTNERSMVMASSAVLTERSAHATHAGAPHWQLRRRWGAGRRAGSVGRRAAV